MDLTNEERALILALRGMPKDFRHLMEDMGLITVKMGRPKGWTETNDVPRGWGDYLFLAFRDLSMVEVIIPPSSENAWKRARRLLQVFVDSACDERAFKELAEYLEGHYI